MKLIRDRKILIQIIIAIVASTVLISSIIGLITMRNSIFYVEKEIHEKLIFHGQGHANDYDSNLIEIETVVNDLQTYAKVSLENEIKNNRVHLKEDQLAMLNSILTTTAENKKTFNDLFIYFNYKGVDTWLNFNTESTLDYEKTLNKEISSNIWLELNQSDDYFYYLSPIQLDDAPSKTIGFIGGKIKKSIFVNTLDIDDTLPSENILMDNSNNILRLKSLHRGEQLFSEETLNTNDINSALESEISGLFTVPKTDGSDLIIAFNRLHNNWVFITTTEKDVALADVNALIRKIISLIIIGSVFSIFTATTVSERITNPIASIVNEITRIGNGEYDKSVATEVLGYNNEIGILALSIETMRKNLNESFLKLKNYNKELESEVKKRTAELYQTNEYLEISLAELEEHQAELIIVNDNLEKSMAALKQTQNQLVEAQKISALNFLVNGIRHKLNTPIGATLTSISCVSEETDALMVKMKDNKATAKEVYNVLEKVNEIATMSEEHLNNAKDMLNMFKEISADTGTEKPRIIDLCEYLDKVIATVQLEPKYSQYNIQAQCHDRIIIRSYPSVFLQIFSNLVSNSVKHGFKDSGKGDIIIKAKATDGAIYIEYSDNGVGIESDQINQIFDPFFTTNLSTDNTGLGLNIVYNIIRTKLKGTIKCESEIDKGVLFTIEIPVTE